MSDLKPIGSHKLKRYASWMKQILEWVKTYQPELRQYHVMAKELKGIVDVSFDEELRRERKAKRDAENLRRRKAGLPPLEES
jgi:hypothetical protein